MACASAATIRLEEIEKSTDLDEPDRHHDHSAAAVVPIRHASAGIQRQNSAGTTRAARCAV